MNTNDNPLSNKETETVHQILRDVLELDQATDISPDTRLTDLGADSLDDIEIVMAWRNNLTSRFPTRSWKSC